MQAKGNDVLITPKPRDLITKGGIIIPDTTTLKSQEWGIATEISGNIDMRVGDRVLYFGARCYKQGDTKIVSHKEVIYWEDGKV